MLIEFDFKPVAEAMNDFDFLYSAEPNRVLLLVGSEIHLATYESAHGFFYVFDGIEKDGSTIYHLYPHEDSPENDGIVINGVADARIMVSPI